jgi:sigma-B regulation protein RsbU (phosphoserine phosphatase)
VLALAAFLPVLILLAILAARAVTKPVSQLSKAARRLAAGDFEAHTDIRSGDELEELGRLFNAMVPQLDASIRMRESLSLAQELQRNLLPHAPPAIPGLDIAGLSLYCDETGGDYYDFLPLPDLGPDKVAVLIGDVAGHGISAALLMTTARALLRSRSLRPGELARTVGEVNAQLCRDSHAGRFMTLFLAVLDAGRQTIHWVGAGHEPGLIFDPVTQSVQTIDGEDIPLGVDPAWAYHEHSHTGWNPGTVLLLGTDGISETRDPAGEMFGRAAVLQLIRNSAHLPAAEIAQAVTDALVAFRGESPQRDDVTLVVVKAAQP